MKTLLNAITMNLLLWEMRLARCLHATPARRNLMVKFYRSKHRVHAFFDPKGAAENEVPF